MKAWLMAIFGSAAELVTQTFTSNTTWTAPVAVYALATLVGKGTNGTPGSPSEYQWRMVKYRYTQAYYANGSSESIDFPGSRVGDTPSEGGATPPGPYCDAKRPAGSGYPAGTQLASCYYYQNEYELVANPPSNGQPTTGFGKTFPGGTGGAAVPATYSNVAVTPGQAYPLVVPVGGSITISYYR